MSAYYLISTQSRNRIQSPDWSYWNAGIMSRNGLLLSFYLGHPDCRVWHTPILCLLRELYAFAHTIHRDDACFPRLGKAEFSCKCRTPGKRCQTLRDMPLGLFRCPKRRTKTATAEPLTLGKVQRLFAKNEFTEHAFRLERFQSYRRHLYDE